MVINALSKRHQAAAMSILVLALIGIPFVSSEYYLHLFKLCMFYALAALGLNLVVGYTGQFSLAQAAFLGIGAYVTAFLSARCHVPAIVAIIISGIVAAIFGIFLGLPTLRLSGGYLAVATIAFSQTVWLVFVNWVNVTGGPSGFRGIPPFELSGIVFEKSFSQYYLILLVIVLSTLLISQLVHSHIGRALKAIRENEMAATVMGINTLYYKVLSFAVGSFLAGVSGSLLAFSLRFISPDLFSFTESIAILSMVVIGGVGSIPGAFLGSVIVTILPEWMRSLGDFRLLFYGLSFVLITLFCPTGLAGIIQNLSGPFKSGTVPAVGVPEQRRGQGGHA